MRRPRTGSGGRKGAPPLRSSVKANEERDEPQLELLEPVGDSCCGAVAVASTADPLASHASLIGRMALGRMELLGTALGSVTPGIIAPGSRAGAEGGVEVRALGAALTCAAWR